MTGKRLIPSGFPLDLSCDRQAPKLSRKANVVLDQHIISNRRLKLVGRKACFRQCITPSEPKVRIPLGLSNPSLTLEQSFPRSFAAIFVSNLLNGFDYLRFFHALNSE